MWFKQVSLFQLTNKMRPSPTELCEKLGALEYKECLPSMPYAAGWVSPVDEEGAPLVQAMNGYLMICLQIEEKILPAIVVRQALDKQVKQIEALENRKVSPKQKYALKDEIIATLLPRAFSKLIKVYAYIDTKNHWLILGTTHTKKIEQFIATFKKTLGDHIESFQVNKLSSTMTAWLKYQNHASSFSIEKSCVLQDANQESRVIRCKEQDLFASSIQSLIKEGCIIKQLALNWQDRVDFVLVDTLSLQNIRFADEIIEQIKDMEAGTKQQQFNADFLMMTETMDGLLKDLLDSSIKKQVESDSNVDDTVEMVS